MKRQNRKGFTIVELVIVIAVIAILAAVLIPTFAGLVAKANMAADQQAVNQMNKALAMTGETLDNLDAVIDALDAQGFNSKKALIPVSKGHTFYWDKVNKEIILVDAENKVVFPTDATYDADNCESLEAGYKYVDIDAADTKTLEAALMDGNEKINLSADVTITKAIFVKAGSNVTINLNGNNINSSAVAGRPFELSDGTTLTINAEGSVVDCGKYGLVDINAGSTATVVLNGGTYNSDTDNGAVIKVRGGAVANVTLKNVTMKDSYTTYTGKDNYLIHNEKGSLTLNVEGGEFTGNVGFVNVTNANINGAKFVTDGYAVYAVNGTITNCNFEIGTYKTRDGQGVDASAVAVAGGTVAVTKCIVDTDSVAFDVLTSGGTINATECNITGESFRNRGDNAMNEGTTAKITIDGVVVYTASK